MNTKLASKVGAGWRYGALAVVGAAGLVAAFPAQATDLWIAASGCATLNCNSIVINGSLNAYGGDDSFSGTYVTKVWAEAGRCLRLDVLNDFSASPDFEMTVVAPGGTVYRNDQGGGSCINCPIVAINNTPGQGWYTVALHSWTGAPISANFQLAYGHYTLNNAPNCSSPTTALSLLRPAKNSSLRPTVSPEDAE